MFNGCTALVTAPALPATTLVSNCYYNMFAGCSSLTTAPALPATTLTFNCYAYMFAGCSSLTTAPELPATTLAERCYRYMFRDCTSLTTAPELPATTLASQCYAYMFQGCSKLNNITMLATDISETDCLTNWVSGVSEGGTFIKNPDMVSLPSGVNGIPNKWAIHNLSDKYKILLNGEWRLNNAISIGSSFNGVYESFINYNINSKSATCYIDVENIPNFAILVRSYGENNYDYIMVSQLDKNIDNNTNYNNINLVKASTRGLANGATAIGAYTQIRFEIPPGKHRITIVYRKDGSTHQNDDRGYIVIPKSFL